LTPKPIRKSLAHSWATALQKRDSGRTAKRVEFHLKKTNASPGKKHRVSAKNPLDDINILSEGDTFGEMALLNDKPQECTLTALGLCKLGSLDKAAFQDILGRAMQMRLNEQVYFFQKQPWFSGWTRTLLTKLIDLFKLLTYRRGERVFTEGEEANYVYMVHKGEFKLVKDIEIEYHYGRKSAQTKKRRNEGKTKERSLKKKYQSVKRRIEVKMIGEGEMLGFEEMIMAREHRNLTCFCNSQYAEVYQISVEDFMTIFKSRNDILYKLRQRSIFSQQKCETLIENFKSYVQGKGTFPYPERRSQSLDLSDNCLNNQASFNNGSPSNDFPQSPDKSEGKKNRFPLPATGLLKIMKNMELEINAHNKPSINISQIKNFSTLDGGDHIKTFAGLSERSNPEVDGHGFKEKYHDLSQSTLRTKNTLTTMDSSPVPRGSHQWSSSEILIAKQTRHHNSQQKLETITSQFHQDHQLNGRRRLSFATMSADTLNLIHNLEDDPDNDDSPHTPSPINTQIRHKTVKFPTATGRNPSKIGHLYSHSVKNSNRYEEDDGVCGGWSPGGGVGWKCRSQRNLGKSVERISFDLHKRKFESSQLLPIVVRGSFENGGGGGVRLERKPRERFKLPMGIVVGKSRGGNPFKQSSLSQLDGKRSLDLFSAENSIKLQKIRRTRNLSCDL